MNANKILNLRASEKTVGCTQRSTKNIQCRIILAVIASETYGNEKGIETWAIVGRLNQSGPNVMRYLRMLESEGYINSKWDHTDRGWAGYRWSLALKHLTK